MNIKLSEFRGKNGTILKMSKNDTVSERMSGMGYSVGMRVDFVLSYAELCEYRIGETLLAVRGEACDKIMLSD